MEWIYHSTKNSNSERSRAGMPDDGLGIAARVVDAFACGDALAAVSVSFHCRGMLLAGDSRLVLAALLPTTSLLSKHRRLFFIYFRQS